MKDDLTVIACIAFIIWVVAIGGTYAILHLDKNYPVMPIAAE